MTLDKIVVAREQLNRIRMPVNARLMKPVPVCPENSDYGCCLDRIGDHADCEFCGDLRGGRSYPRNVHAVRLVEASTIGPDVALAGGR